VSDGFDPVTIERRIRAYESFGLHRTGWPGDDQSAKWMAEELGAAGIEVELERFHFPRVEVRTARLSWPEGAADGVPLYDGGFTPMGGIQGDLVEAGEEDVFGNIIVARENDPSFTQRDIAGRIEDLQEAGALALVLPRRDPAGEITVLNAQRIDAPYKLPVLQVSGNAARTLSSAVFLGTEATIEIDADRLRSNALNVVATLPGADPDAEPVGIMTPRSGWFTCASERGGGIAILLGLADALAAMPDRRRTVHLVASSGHEINHYGLSAYLEQRSGIERQAIGWLHLGANIGTSTGPVRAESDNPELHELAEQALERAGARFEMIDVRGGEALNISKAGGRYISFRGANDYFHSPNDVFDTASDAQLVSAAGRAALTVVESWLQ
jgi:hypothetical protein